MTWYKVYKRFRGGQSPVGYFSVPKYSDKEVVKDAAEDWAENTLGGENYGWTVYWSKAKRPSKKWLKRKIGVLCGTIEDCELRITELKCIDDSI